MLLEMVAYMAWLEEYFEHVILRRNSSALDQDARTSGNTNLLEEEQYYSDNAREVEHFGIS